MLPEAVWQRCYVHFLRNALDHVPRKVDDDCLQELRWFYERRSWPKCGRPRGVARASGSRNMPKLCDWVEENIEETLTFYRLPLAHHKHMKSTNMLERLNQEIKRRTQWCGFPQPGECLRLVRALAVETHEELAGSHALSQHGSPARAQKADAEAGGMSRPGLLKDRAVLAALKAASRRLRRWPRPALTAAARGACDIQAGTEKRRLSRTKKHQLQLWLNNFAELDAHN